MIQAFYDLLGIQSINSYSDLCLVMAAIITILFTVTSFLQLISALFKGR